MGLDMYLYADRYIVSFGNEDDPDTKLSQVLKEFCPEMSNMEPHAVRFQIAYWRKANAIHKWFVDNVQDGVDDCGYYHVTEEQLAELYELVSELLKTKDEDKAHELLPPTSGFFFGSDMVDDDYWSDLEDTLDQLTKIRKNLMMNALKGKNFYMDFHYHSSW
jgi:hypothetical protein